jgi:xanthine dehydrogenase accessory factor
LPIGSRTPAEIALSLMAEVVALKNGALVSQALPEQRCA